MIFTDDCRVYIEGSTCSKQIARRVLDAVAVTLPRGLSTIDWMKIQSKIEVDGVDRTRLKGELINVAAALGISLDETLYIINLDDAIPPLKSSLREWLKFADELDFVDTIFMDEKKSTLIQWDFYKNLHATRMRE